MKYRMLNVGEVIQDCDDVNVGTAGNPIWRETRNQGLPVPNYSVGYYRRPIFDPIPVRHFRFYRGRLVK